MAQAAVDIFVTSSSRAGVERALGARPARVRVCSHLSRREDARRLLVAPLSELETEKHREEVAELWQEVAGPSTAFVVLVQAPFARPLWSTFVVQLLLDWSRRFAPGKGPAPFVAADAATMRRLVLARLHGADDQLIASALVEGGTLYVWSCEPKLYMCSAESLPALQNLSPDELRRVAVSESGSHLHWDAGDVDLDLDTIRFHADPAYRAKREAATRHEAARYAKAIQRLRTEHGLRQAAIPGLSEREIRRLERGETIPHAATLHKLAAAHGMSVDAYLARLATLSTRER